MFRRKSSAPSPQEQCRSQFSMGNVTVCFYLYDYSCSAVNMAQQQKMLAAQAQCEKTTHAAARVIAGPVVNDGPEGAFPQRL
jgi:hypothetical protein